LFAEQFLKHLNSARNSPERFHLALGRLGEVLHLLADDGTFTALASLIPDHRSAHCLEFGPGAVRHSG